MNEADFIAALRDLPLHPGSRGLEDDCAVLEIGGEILVVTHDSMAEGTHWIPGTDPFYVAWKLVASNLSDLAAKGAAPIGILLSYDLAENDERFIEGLRAILSKYNVPLLGGDTIASTGAQTVGVTALGRATHSPVPSRTGAQLGDRVYLCGEIGDAMHGYDLLTLSDRYKEHGLEMGYKNPPEPYFVQKFLRPEPLLQEGQELAPFVTAMMDVSDGLFLDAHRLAEASQMTISLEMDLIPHSRRFLENAAQGNWLDVKTKGLSVRMGACAWGEDYALLFTAPQDIELPVKCTRIGEVVRDSRHSLLVDGRPVRKDRLGYQHG